MNTLGEGAGPHHQILSSLRPLPSAVSLDFACSFLPRLQERCEALYESLRERETAVGTGNLHGAGHIIPCQVEHQLVLKDNTGSGDGECAERAFAGLKWYTQQDKLCQLRAKQAHSALNYARAVPQYKSYENWLESKAHYMQHSNENCAFDGISETIKQNFHTAIAKSAVYPKRLLGKWSKGGTSRAPI